MTLSSSLSMCLMDKLIISKDRIRTTCQMMKKEESLTMKENSLAIVSRLLVRLMTWLQEFQIKMRYYATSHLKHL